MPRQVYIQHGGCCTPNPGGQEAFVNEWTARHVALAGGWGAGKTWAGARKLLQLHIWNAMQPVHRPGSDEISHYEPTYVPSAIVAPSYRNAWDYDIPAFIAACNDAGVKHRLRTADMEIHLPELGTTADPSVVMIRTAEAPRKIAGWQVGAAWGDEVTRWKEDRFNVIDDPLIQLLGRVRHPLAAFCQIMLTFTHEGDATEVFEMFEEGPLDEFALYSVPTAENPLMRDWERRQRRVLPPELAEQYLDAKPIRLRGGVVYPEFERGTHVDKTLVLDKQRDLHLCLDFNISPGMHGLIGQYMQELDLFTVVHELYAPRLDVRGLVKELVDWLREAGWSDLVAEGRPGERTLQIFGDATGRSEWAGTSESCYQILRDGLVGAGIRHRVRVPPSNPPVSDRVNAVRVALLDMDGKIHWKCHPRCAILMRDLTKMKRDANGNVDKSDRKMSHASDAEGYRIAYLRPARVRSEKTAAGRFSVTVGS